MSPRAAWRRFTAGVLGAAALAAVAGAATAQPARIEKAQLAAHADRTAYEPSEALRLAVVMAIEPGWHTNSHTPTFEYLIPTAATVTLPAGWEPAAVAYPPGVMQTFAFADQPLSVYEGTVILEAVTRVPADAAAGEAPATVELRYQACDDRSCLPPVTTRMRLTLRVGGGGQPVAAELFATAGAAGGAAGGAGRGGGAGLSLMLALGLLGGMILNAMPCVLPILSLKVFGLVRSTAAGRRAVIAGSLATAAGILASFWGLAAAAVAARAAGAAVGWGVQFQEPVFVAFLLVVVALFCLNLWGLFEVPLPQALARLGSAGGSREGVAGHFGAGLFATLMATPCSAPFLGTAVGFALVQPAPVVAAVFTAVGTGMALPYLALAAFPASARLLPRPGRWMDTLKGMMGFLLAAAAVWLLYVLTGQVSPERVALLQLGVLVLAASVWLGSRSLPASGLRRLALAAAVASAAGVVALAATSPAPPRDVAAAGPAAGLIPWVPFDHAEAERLAAAGQLVFVDVTADWCFTCKVNERLTLETREVVAAFTRLEVVAMQADWTRRDDAIAAYLADFGRSGIPFYALYRPGSPPHVFSELLTRGELLAVLEAEASARVAARPSAREPL